MTKTGETTISSLLLPRALGGPLMHFDEPNPPNPAPPPPAPPAPPPAPPPVHHAPPPPPAPQRASSDDPAALRAEAAAYRIDARTAREAEAAARAEADRIRQEADQRVATAEATAAATISERNQQIADARLMAEAATAGLTDLDLLPMIDRTTIVVDAKGNVTGVAEAIAAFKAKKPNYFTAGGPPPAPRTGNPAPPVTPGSPPPSPATARTLPPAEYRAAQDQAIRALKDR